MPETPQTFSDLVRETRTEVITVLEAGSRGEKAAWQFFVTMDDGRLVAVLLNIGGQGEAHQILFVEPERLTVEPRRGRMVLNGDGSISGPSGEALLYPHFRAGNNYNKGDVLNDGAVNRAVVYDVEDIPMYVQPSAISLEFLSVCFNIHPYSIYYAVRDMREAIGIAG